MDPISLYAVTQKVDKQTFFINQKSGKEKKVNQEPLNSNATINFQDRWLFFFKQFKYAFVLKLGRKPVGGKELKRVVEKEVSCRDACVSLRYFKKLHTNKCGSGIYIGPKE